jgi:DNA-binding transcriptional LysR family regulator
VQFRANWQFHDGAIRISVPVKGRVEANSPHAIAAAARAGLGFCRVPSLIVSHDVASGRLVTLLEDYEPQELGIFIVYPHRERMPVKLRVFIDHLVAWFEAERKAGRTC